MERRQGLLHSVLVLGRQMAVDDCLKRPVHEYRPSIGRDNRHNRRATRQAANMAGTAGYLNRVAGGLQRRAPRWPGRVRSHPRASLWGKRPLLFPARAALTPLLPCPLKHGSGERVPRGAQKFPAIACHKQNHRLRFFQSPGSDSWRDTASANRKVEAKRA